MKRRNFLKNIAVGSLALNIKPNLFAQTPNRPDLAVVKG